MRGEAEARYPTLRQFLLCSLHEDWLIDLGTPQQAVDAAIAENPPGVRQQVRRELVALLASVDDDTRLRRILNEGLGVNVAFRRAGEARAFAEEVERKLLLSLKAGFKD
jgi:hypothetical protein